MHTVTSNLQYCSHLKKKNAQIARHITYTGQSHQNVVLFNSFHLNYETLQVLRMALYKYFKYSFIAGTIPL